MKPGVGVHIALGLMALGMLMPVTLPVPSLRTVVADRFDVSEFATSCFMSISMVGAMLAAPLAGLLVDRFGRRSSVLTWALVVDAGLVEALAWDMPFAMFMAIRFFEGCAGIIALSVTLSLGADLAARAGHPSRMGLLGGGLTLGVALGAPVGGVLGKYAPLAPFHVGALILLATALGAGLSGLRIAERGPQMAGQRPGLQALVRSIVQEPALLVPLAYAFVDRFTVGFFTTTFPLYATRVLGFDGAHVGLSLAAFLLPFSLLSYPAGKLSERVSRTVLVAGGSALYGLAVVGVGFAGEASLVVLMLALGVLSAAMFVPSLILVTDLAPQSARGTALGAFNAAGSLGFVVGPLVGGAVSQTVASLFAGEDGPAWHMGYRAAFGVAGLSEILCVLTTVWAMRRMVAAGRTS